MPDPSAFGEDWLGRTVTAVVTAGLTLLGSVFATRKNAEAALMEKVNQRVDQMLKHQGLEIKRLDRALKDDRELCDEQLKELRDQISRLMKGPVAAYTEHEIDRAEGRGHEHA